MNSGYDMYVDDQTLEQLKLTLKRISSELAEATRKMLDALQVSQDFLSGNQFEKATALTLQTVETASLTLQNIDNAITYLQGLGDHLNDYTACKYTGG